MVENGSYELITIVKRLAVLTHQSIDIRLRPYDLARTQYATLYYLQRQPDLTGRELAEKLMVEPATLSGIVDTLVAKGLAERTGDQTDKRRKQLVLTDKGMSLLSAISPPAPIVEELLLRGVDTHELAIMKSVAKKMIANLEHELLTQTGGQDAAKNQAKIS